MSPKTTVQNILSKYADVIREAQENFDRLPESYKEIYRREIDASIKRRTTSHDR